MAKIILPNPPQWGEHITVQQVATETQRWMEEVKRRIDAFEVWGVGHQGLSTRLVADQVPYQTGAAATPSDTPAGAAIRAWKDTGTGFYYLEIYIPSVGWKKVQVA